MGKGQRGVEVCLSEGKRSPCKNAVPGLYFCLYVFPWIMKPLLQHESGSMDTYIPVSLAGWRWKTHKPSEDQGSSETRQACISWAMTGLPVPHIPSVNLHNSFSAGFAASTVLKPKHPALSASKTWKPKVLRCKSGGETTESERRKNKGKKSQKEARAGVMVKQAWICNQNHRTFPTVAKGPLQIPTISISKISHSQYTCSGWTACLLR